MKLVTEADEARRSSRQVNHGSETDLFSMGNGWLPWVRTSADIKPEPKPRELHIAQKHPEGELGTGTRNRKNREVPVRHSWARRSKATALNAPW
jgi:hypothetical protein